MRRFHSCRFLARSWTFRRLPIRRIPLGRLPLKRFSTGRIKWRRFLLFKPLTADGPESLRIVSCRSPSRDRWRVPLSELHMAALHVVALHMTALHVAALHKS